MATKRAELPDVTCVAGGAGNRKILPDKGTRIEAHRKSEKHFSRVIAAAGGWVDIDPDGR
jgi:hypothetical protein